LDWHKLMVLVCLLVQFGLGVGWLATYAGATPNAWASAHITFCATGAVLP
jgi:hypothetical protein